MLYCSVMNNKLEILMNKHIERIQTNINNRDQSVYGDGTRCNPWHASLDAVDLKNIASLREGRIPQYGDHIELLGDSSELGRSGLDMFEFADLTEMR